MVLMMKSLEVMAGLAGLLAGILLILPCTRISRLARLRRWLLETDILALLDTRRIIEKPIYRHHRLSGITLIWAALLWMWLLRQFSAHYRVVHLLREGLGTPGAETLVVACWLFVSLALVIGLFLLIRPSSMKRLEAAANHWIELFPSNALSLVSEGASNLICRTPRLAGVLLLVGGIGCLMTLRW